MNAIYTYWADCPEHGISQYPTAGNFDDGRAYCFRCKDFTATARSVKLTGGSKIVEASCDDRCLNGFRSCGCICKGACHGVGNCNPELHPKILLKGVSQ